MHTPRREIQKPQLIAVTLEDQGAGIRLVPFTEADVDDMDALSDHPGVYENTYVPAERGHDFARNWVGRYVDGWRDGSCAGFTIRSATDDSFLGFAALVSLELGKGEAEAGYVVGAHARGRGVATAALRTVSRWGIDVIGLQRIYLKIDPQNIASTKVAERCGFFREGILRSVYFKEGQRTDTAVYSLLPSDLK